MQAQPGGIVDMEDSRYIACSVVVRKVPQHCRTEASLIDYIVCLTSNSYAFSFVFHRQHRDPRHVSIRQRLRTVVLCLRPQSFSFNSPKP
jgi:hypothetical protein